MSPNNKDLNSILNYEEIVSKIEKISYLKHHELLEDLAENIFNMIFRNKLVKKINLKIEKLDILKKTKSVGIEGNKIKSMINSLELGKKVIKEKIPLNTKKPRCLQND